MARPRKTGVDYFSFDVDFFSDKKIRILRSRFGADGVEIYIYLLCEVYRNGYYIRIDDDYEYLIADELRMSIGKVKQVLKFLLERSLFDNTLFQSDTIITSHGIQARFQEAVKTRASKSGVEVEQKYWLLSSEETQPFIKFTQKYSYSEKNPSYSEKNPDYSEKNDIKESKVKESKVKESKVDNSPPPDFNAEKAWDDTFCIYPKKSEASVAKQKWMDKILLFTIPENRKDAAQLIYLATKAYLEDYEQRNPEDESFKYLPKYGNWLVNDCDYWMTEVQKEVKHE